MTDLEHAILAKLRARGDKAIRARDLEALPEAHKGAEMRGATVMRYVDQTVQRMRRKGTVSYDSKLGWRTGVQTLREDP